MKNAVSIVLICLALAACGATTTPEVIYWTGKENRLGGGNKENFSTEPRGGQYVSVKSGSRFHFVFNTNAMSGGRKMVRLNRKDLLILSLNIASPKDTGFKFDTIEINAAGLVLAGKVNVVSGQHEFLNTGQASLALAGRTIWHIRKGAHIRSHIRLTGPGGITKTGQGRLILRHAEHDFRGDLIIREGAFGGSGSLTGNLRFGKDARWQFNPEDTLAVAGESSFERFGIEKVSGLDENTPDGAYTILQGTVDLSNVRNIGKGNAHALNRRKIAWFEEAPDKLRIIVTSE